MAPKLTVSIVTYESQPLELERSIQCVLESSLDLRLYVIDNSGYDGARALCRDERVTYLFNDRNLGFAAGHNIALRLASEHRAPYHLVMNPDVYFEAGSLEKLAAFLDDEEEVGLAMPKVLYPDGSLQYLCKLLPTPLDLVGRRFLRLGPLRPAGPSRYELGFTGYRETMDVPHLSGCFMFLRRDALERAGGFDERYFLYLEDVDLSRRVGQHFRTVYYPEVSVFHRRAQGSYRSLRLLLYHVQSAVRYFNKWGYFFDEERRRVNQAALARLGAAGALAPGRERVVAQQPGEDRPR